MDRNIGRPRLAMVEDEADFRESAVDYLRASGFPAWGVGSGEEFYKRLLTDPVDIVILDIGLPGESGFEIAEHLSNSQRTVGVIILSARSKVSDRLIGLGRGADCYLVKPVDFQELIANIEALWRRINTARAAESMAPILEDASAQPWILDRERWLLTSPAGQEMKLTSKEFAFVRSLVAAGGELVSKAALAEVLSGNPMEYDYHRIDVMLSRLRKKGQQMTGMPLPVKTIQSYGYAFTAPCLQR